MIAITAEPLLHKIQFVFNFVCASESVWATEKEKQPNQTTNKEYLPRKWPLKFVVKFYANLFGICTFVAVKRAYTLEASFPQRFLSLFLTPYSLSFTGLPFNLLYICNCNTHIAYEISLLQPVAFIFQRNCNAIKLFCRKNQSHTKISPIIKRNPCG